MTVVRALETLDQPSRVTLIGCSRYVEQGILYGVHDWKQNGWRWDVPGNRRPPQYRPLATDGPGLQIHRVECGWRRFDAGHGLAGGPHSEPAQTGQKLGGWNRRGRMRKMLCLVRWPDGADLDKNAVWPVVVACSFFRRGTCLIVERPVDWQVAGQLNSGDSRADDGIRGNDQPVD